jgi:hypothetical protein
MTLQPTKKNFVNKLAHALVLAVFGIACCFTWVILTLASRTGHGEGLPGFTTFCVGLRRVLIVLPVMAAAYCFWIWFRRAERLSSWIGFFAATMSVLVLVTLPTLIAAYLPLIKAINHFAGN